LQNQNILKWVFWNFEVTPMKRDSRNLTVQELCAQRAAELMAETQANQQRNEILCHWPEALRAIPTQVIRSALFGVVEKGSARRYNEQTLIPSWKGVSIRYQGPLLSQTDQHVWTTVIHQFRGKPLSEPLGLPRHALLQALGWNRSARQYVQLEESLTRLVAGLINIEAGKDRYVGTLMVSFLRHGDTAHYHLKVNPEIAALFANNLTLLDPALRVRIRTDLGRWMLGYVQSHRTLADKPHRIGLEQLQTLCGSRAGAWDFKYRLKKVMVDLEDHGVVAAWSWTKNGALEFWRPAT